MSLLSSFVVKQVLAGLEAELIKHEPDIQSAMLGEVQAFTKICSDWVTRKLTEAAEQQINK